MTRKRKVARPADPMEIARRRAAERARERDPAAWGLDAEALTGLEAHDQVEISRDLAGRATRARRADVFENLRGRGALSVGAYEAIRRLQGDMAILHRTEAGTGNFAPRVDQSRTPGAFAEVRHRAGLRIEAALTRAGPASAALLSALCEADVVLGRAEDWRAVVAHQTGERLADAQGAVLRAACENLAGAYRSLSRD